MLDFFPLEELMYKAQFKELDTKLEKLTEKHPDDFYLSVFTSRYYEKRGDYKQAIPLAEKNWEVAKKSGKKEWIIAASIPLLEIYYMTKLFNLTKYIDIILEVEKLDLSINLRADPEDMKYLGQYLVLRKWYSAYTVENYEILLKNLQDAEKIFAQLNFLPGIIETLITYPFTQFVGYDFQVQSLEKVKQLIDKNHYKLFEVWYLFAKVSMEHVRSGTNESEKVSLEISITLADELMNPVLKHQIIAGGISTLNDRQIYDSVKSSSEKLIAFGEESTLPEFSVWGYYWLTQYYITKGMKSEGLEAIAQNRYFLKQSGNTIFLNTFSLFNEVGFHQKLGEMDKAFQITDVISQNISKIKQDYGFTYVYAEVQLGLRLTAMLYTEGNHQQSIVHEKQLLGLLLTGGDFHDVAHTYQRISLRYQSLGELDLATEFALKSQESYRKEQSRAEIHSLRSLGNIAKAQRNFTQAIDYYSQALQMAELIGSLYLLQTHYELLPCFIFVGKVDRAQQTLKEMQDLEHEHEGRTSVWSWVRLSEARIYAQSRRVREQAKATDLLLEILLKDTISDMVQVETRTLLTELLYAELKQYGDDEVYQEIKNHLDILEEKSKTQFIYPTLVEVLIIKSRLALIDGDLEKSLSLLTQADLICEEKGMKFLQEKVEKETNLVNAEVDKWTAFSKKNSTLIERVEQVDLDNYFDMAKMIRAQEET